ncbi:MAG: SDR family oxidoreductase [Pseudomonadota bacterium]
MILAFTLAIVLGTVLGSILYARRQARAKTMAEWAVGGRRFGILIFWFLNAGEIYTTFAVLGISGFAWAYGAPAYLALTSVSLAAVIGYWIMPRIWAAGHRDNLVTQADFFAAHYRATWLGVIVGLAGIAALIVYVQIQITALGLILRLTLGQDVSPALAASLAAVVMVAFVFIAGLRSAAFAAGVKDVLMLVVVVVLCGGAAAAVGASSMLDIYTRVQDRFPTIGSFPGLQPEAGLDSTWLMTSALNVAIGNWILPHLFQLCFSAGSRKTIRRNAVLQPIYSLSYFFIILLGFAALPSMMRTPTLDRLVPREIVAYNEDAALLPRMGGPQDVANMVAFLASDESSYLSGQVFPVDGGTMAHLPTYGDERRYLEGYRAPLAAGADA